METYQEASQLPWFEAVKALAHAVHWSLDAAYRAASPTIEDADMSQPAPKRTVVPPAPPPAALADKTGRFRRSTATLLPPAGAAA